MLLRCSSCGGATARLVASGADVPRRRRLRLGPRPRVAPGVGVRRPRLRARRARGLPDAAGRGLPLLVIRAATVSCGHCTACAATRSVICEEAHGRAGRRGVSLSPVDLRPCRPPRRGTLDARRRRPGRARPRVAHCATIGGLVYVCVAGPPDVAPLRSLVEPYLAPFDLERAVVAHRTTFVEHANWKLVMENNRECYHCRLAHPAVRLVPGRRAPTGRARRAAGRARRVRGRARRPGCRARLAIADDRHYRVMRMPFEHGATGNRSTGDRRRHQVRRASITPGRGRRAAVSLPVVVEPLHGRPRGHVSPPAGAGCLAAATWLVLEGGPLTEADLERLTAAWLATRPGHHAGQASTASHRRPTNSVRTRRPERASSSSSTGMSNGCAPACAPCTAGSRRRSELVERRPASGRSRPRSRTGAGASEVDAHDHAVWWARRPGACRRQRRCRPRRAAL